MTCPKSFVLTACLVCLVLGTAMLLGFDAEGHIHVMIAKARALASGHSRSRVVRGQIDAAVKDGSTPEAARILLVQLAALRKKEASLGDDMKALQLHSSIGHVYLGDKNYVEAIRHYGLARDLAKQLGDSELIVAAQSTLGGAYASAGRLQEASEELEAAYLLMDRKGPNIFPILWSLGNVRRDSGKIDEALQLYGEAEKIQQILKEQQQTQREWHIPVHESLPVTSVAGLLSDTGRAYHSRGKLEKAVEHYRKSLKILGENTAKSDSTDLPEIYNRLGQALHDQGDVEGATKHYHKALKLQQTAVDLQHPSVIGTLMNIARSQRDSGDRNAALSTLKRAEGFLHGQESGPEHSGILSMKADILREKGDLKEAESNAREAVEAHERIVGARGTPEMAVLLNGLGSIFHDQHKYKDAVQHYMKALDINLKTVGTLHPETAATYNNLGNAYQDAGDDTHAERYYMDCLDIQKKLYEQSNPELATTYNNIATILVRQKRLPEAEELLAKAVAVAQAAGLPSTSPDRVVYEENLEEVRQNLKKVGFPEKTVAPSGRPAKNTHVSIAV